MKITILKGYCQGKEFDFSTPTVTIGRDGGNQLILDTDGVSRCHAELKQLPDGSWEVRDLNSTNGVKVADTRIDGPVKIYEGARIQVGENVFQVSNLSQEPPQVIFTPIISMAPAPENVGAEVKYPAPESTASVPVEEQKKPVTVSGEAPSPQADAGSAWDLSKFSGSFFGGGKQNANSEQQPQGLENEKKKRRSNIIFYAIVTCVVIMILSFAFSIISPAKKGVARTVQEKPLAVKYEKEIISKDNVFRFVFHLKSRMRRFNESRKTKEGTKTVQVYKREYIVTFTIDDIASQRHFTRETVVSSETVEQLRAAVTSSGILAASQNPVARDDSYRRSLSIVEGQKLTRTVVAGEYGSSEFNAVEEAVIEIAESFGLKTISMTPEELFTQAERNFNKAEELFSNPARPSNLRDAIKRYKMVVEALEQFSPKPPMWDKARRQLAAATKQRDLKMGALEIEYKRLLDIRELGGLRNVFLEMMELSDPESREYSLAKRRLVSVEQYLRKRKSKR